MRRFLASLPKGFVALLLSGLLSSGTLAAPVPSHAKGGLAALSPSLAEGGLAAVPSEQPYKRASLLKKYRTAMKEKNYMTAWQLLHDAALQHEAAANDPQLAKYQVDALNEQIGVENRKIYLNTKPDTAAYFSYIHRLTLTGLHADSLEQAALDVRRAQGKKATPQLRPVLAQTLLSYRKNLVGAGKYYYRKKDYSQAYTFFHLYLDTKASPLFIDSKGNSHLADPDDLTDISVLATLAAYGMNNHEGVMTHLTESLQDKNLESQLLEVGAKSAAALGDTIEALRLLENGFFSYPSTEYFFITLTRYYNDHRQYDKALQKALRMTELQPKKRDYWYMAGKEQTLLNRYEDALRSFAHCILLQADDAESYAAIGNIYLHQAHEAYAQFDLPLTDPRYQEQKKHITDLYRQSCQAFENARKYGENTPDLWLTGLRETYFKLNKGKELKKLERTHPSR